jgi:hypothetical protein
MSPWKPRSRVRQPHSGALLDYTIITGAIWLRALSARAGGQNSLAAAIVIDPVAIFTLPVSASMGQADARQAA